MTTLDEAIAQLRQNMKEIGEFAATNPVAGTATTKAEPKPKSQREIDADEVRAAYDLSPDWKERSKSLVYHTDQHREGMKILLRLEAEQQQEDSVAAERQADLERRFEARIEAEARASVGKRQQTDLSSLTEAQVNVEIASLRAQAEAAKVKP